MRVSSWGALGLMSRAERAAMNLELKKMPSRRKLKRFGCSFRTMMPWNYLPAHARLMPEVSIDNLAFVGVV